MKATVLIDNIAPKGLKDEWGLCVHIEHEGKNILLDTGAGRTFKENAKKLGVDISEVDYGVISHAHFDHADGLEVFFNSNADAKVYIRKSCEENCYARRLCFAKYIGIKKGILTKFGKRIEKVDSDVEITKGVYLISHKTENLSEKGKKAGMYRKENGKWVPDDFSHEQSLVVKTQKGLVIFNSCCHGGADNIINEVAKTFPNEKIYALVGGFHLYMSSDSEVQKLAQKIEETGISLIYTGHCTGEKAFRILFEKLGDKCKQLYVGCVIEA